MSALNTIILLTLQIYNKTLCSWIFEPTTLAFMYQGDISTKSEHIEYLVEMFCWLVDHGTNDSVGVVITTSSGKELIIF